MRTWLLLLICGLMAISLTATAGELYPFKSAKKQQEFTELSNQLRCLVCQNESLASSQAALAIQLRHEVYEMVKAGESSDDIKRYLVQRYGDFVLFKPPVNSLTYLLWYGPFVLLGLGLLLWLVIAKQRKQAKPVTLAAQDEKTIEELLRS